MNLTASPAVNGTPENQRTAIGADESVRPKSWSYMHRAQWAGALPVPGAVQRTAMCIVDDIDEQTGQQELLSAQMAGATNTCERTIRSHVKMLRPYFDVEDRPGKAWRFTIPAPMMAVVEPRQILPGTPADIAGVGSAPDGPTPVLVRTSTYGTYVHTPRAREDRVRCEKHDRWWPRSCGEDCYECAKDRQHAPAHQHVPKRRMAKAQLPRAYDDEGWFQECTRLHAGRCNGSRGHRLTMQDAEYLADETRRAARGES